MRNIAPPYIVMQLIDGMTLQQKLDKVGILSLKENSPHRHADGGRPCARSAGPVTATSKPANILLENGVERVKITDSV